MIVTDPAALLRSAARSGTGVGAFNVILLEHAEALVAAAESAGAPVVLQISQNAVRYHGALEPLLRATLAVAHASTAPVVVHLDHAERPDLVDEAVRLGIGSVMYDGSRLPYQENVAATAKVAATCHAAGVAVEAELGEVGGKEGAHVPGARTDPAEAAAFVAATGVDSLAVAVGTSHAMTEPGAVVDLDLVRSLRSAVPVPLVLHGSSGLDDAGLRAVVAAGITKVNVGTRLNVAMTWAVRAALDAQPALVDPRRYLAPARAAISAEAAAVLAALAQ
jgi:ketose-bisphosphate aldolase